MNGDGLFVDYVLPADVRKSDWQMLWDMPDGSQRLFPFMEDESANITGLFHEDPAWFASEVNAYDEACNGGEPYSEDERWTADHIGHRWAVLSSDHDLFTVIDGEPVTSGTPGALPITTLWGQR